MPKSEMMAKLNQVYQNIQCLEIQPTDRNVMLMADTYLAIKSLASALQESEQNREEEKAEEKNDGEAESESD